MNYNSKTRKSYKVEKSISKQLKILYTNADQFVNKRDNLLMTIAHDKPDVIMITEVIPKCQINPINKALLKIDNYKQQFNFKPENSNLAAFEFSGLKLKCCL